MATPVPSATWSTSTDKEAKRIYGASLQRLDAYSRHKKYVNDYLLFYGTQNQKEEQLKRRHKNDWDILRENHRFIREEKDDEIQPGEESYSKIIAKKYYEKLFKEFAIVDLSHFETGKIGMRWRTEKEVVIGKGQFICGNKVCQERSSLQSFEVPFGYKEQGEKKLALVKVRVCSECQKKLFHNKPYEVPNNSKESVELKKEKKKKEKKKDRKKKRKHRDSDNSSENESELKKQKKDETLSTQANLEKNNSEEETENDIWTKKKTVEKTQEDEFDEYLQDLFF